MKRNEATDVLTLDCDGTIYPRESALIPLVGKGAMSPENGAELFRQSDRFKERALAGTLTVGEEYEWIRVDLEAFLAGGLTEEAARAALAPARLRPGVRRCLRLMRSLGVPVAIVSYGVADFIRLTLEMNGVAGLVERVYASAMLIQAKSGRYVDFDPASIVIPADKGRWSLRFADSRGALPERILAVGDSGADRTLGHLQRNRLGIAESEEQAGSIAPFMSEVIVTGSFAPVTDWLCRRLGRGP